MILIQLGTTPCTCYRKRLDCAGELLQLRGYLKLIELGLKVHGALRCLAFLSMDLDDIVVLKLILALFPCLLTIVSSPQVCDKYLRTKSYSIVYSCIAVMGVMSGVYKVFDLLSILGSYDLKCVKLSFFYYELTD
ncbi:hypothetical protein RchiOBHm_Chr1g0334921 [Rosa chinensis]|uniref:Uncharacterized protein n=1 Tax=Rosa chinensis TaxID=74649 RepID=A0A2P6SCF6_ROSCH|nr:hypothetical protein RchiOBHm_Chr1g0334921 [Rosa chinensis]